MNYPKFSQLLRLLTCFLLLLAVSLQRDLRYFGQELSGSPLSANDIPIQNKPDGSMVISTLPIAQDISGYGGRIPLRVLVKDQRIKEIQTLKNAETPEFFEKIKDEIISQWIGMTLEEASVSEINGISGATLSSDATNATIRRAVQFAMNTPVTPENSSSRLRDLFPKGILLLLVVLSGAIFPFFIRSKRYRIVQLILNVLILGLWSGTFISYSLIVNFLSHGVDIWKSLIPLLLLFIAFIYPLFNKPSHYCMWLCPLGSLQELAGKSVPYKWKLSPSVLKILSRFRDGLWCILMLLMWSGVYFNWMDYELFTAFIFQQASWAVVTAAFLFVALSFVVGRPYCRFVCPTGALFRITQNPQ